MIYCNACYEQLHNLNTKCHSGDCSNFCIHEYCRKCRKEYNNKLHPCWNRRCQRLSIYRYCKTCYNKRKPCATENCDKLTFKEFCQQCWVESNKHECGTQGCNTVVFRHKYCSTCWEELQVKYHYAEDCIVQEKMRDVESDKPLTLNSNI